MKPQRRQREDDYEIDPDRSAILNSNESSSSPLQSSFSVEDFIVALQQIVAKNDSRDRSEENVSIILTSKIQLIVNNRTNQDLLQVLGEFFMWMMPYTESLTGAEREAAAEERERGTNICSIKEIEDLFVHVLLPCAKSSVVIYSLCRSVCRIALKSDNIYFVTAAARDELVKLVKIAPCEKSLQWAFQAICNLAYTKKDGVPIESNPFVCDEVSTVVYKLFCESTVPQIVYIVSNILRIQVINSTPQFCSTDPYFVHEMLRKLDEATETETIVSIANLVDEVIYKEQGRLHLFASTEAARVFLSKLNSSADPQVLRRVCRCIGNIGNTLQKVSDDFASPEMCRAIFKCFSNQKDENFKNDIMYSIAILTRFLRRPRSTFAQECPRLTQVITEMLLSASDDETRRNVAVVVANISLDNESERRLFNNVAIYEALIHAASRTQDEETKRRLRRAMNNATSVCPDFLPICAARCPFYDERQVELLKIDSLDSLVSNLENSGWVFSAPKKAAFLKLRSILIVLEKFDQFLEVLDQRIEKGDERIEEMLLTIARGFTFLLRTYWVVLFGDPFVDVTLSLLERSSGAANAIFVDAIFSIVMNNRSLSIHPSTVLRLLQKLDKSKKLRDREHNGVKMEFSVYQILGAPAIRNPELFRDNNFLVDNSALIRSCFERSFQIHQFDQNAKDKVTFHITALYKADPRMKEKMFGWDRPVRNVA